MSVDHDPIAAADSLGTDAPQGEAAPWERLRAAREAAGVPIEEVAGWLKLPARRLVALEAGDWSAFPSPAYVRPMVASVCRHLKLDAREFLRDWPDRPDGAPGGAEPRPGTRVQGPAPQAASVSKGYRLFLMGCAVVIVAGVVWLLLADRPPEPSAQVAAAPVTVNDAAAPSSPAATATTTPAPAATAAAPAPAPLATTPDPASGADTVPAPAATPAAQPPADPGPAMVVVRATQESWVEMWDEGGTMRLGRLLQPGDELRYRAKLPFEVVLGNAAGVSVDLFDQPFDFSSKTRANVARFQVNAP
jgi:cytoskeleton protein RodZ